MVYAIELSNRFFSNHAKTSNGDLFTCNYLPFVQERAKDILEHEAGVWDCANIIDITNGVRTLIESISSPLLAKGI